MTESIGISTIADRYAEAVLDIAEEKECLDFVKNDIKTVVETFKVNKNLQQFIEHPLVPVKDKKEVVESIFDNKISPYVINLIKLLLDRNRMFIFEAINESFKKLFNKRFNIALVEVTTAIEIDENIKESLKNKLGEMLSKHIELTTKIDPEIIAGVVIKVEDKVIDGSINACLENIKKQLI